MKTITYYITIIIIAVSAFSCRSNDAAPTRAELGMAAEAGAEAARQAMSLPSGSYGRENAILNIRAKETELRMAGFDECADSFAAAAERIILPQL